MFSAGEVTKYSVGSVSGQLLNCEELINAAPALQLKRCKRLYCYKFSLIWSQWEGINLTFISLPIFFQFLWNIKLFISSEQRLLPGVDPSLSVLSCNFGTLQLWCHHFSTSFSTWITYFITSCLKDVCKVMWLSNRFIGSPFEKDPFCSWTILVLVATECKPPRKCCPRTHFLF